MSTTDNMPTHDDRAVQALMDDGWGGNWTIGPDDLINGVALVLRTVRDDLLLLYVKGQIRTLDEVENYLNARVTALTGRSTVTGDTD